MSFKRLRHRAKHGLIQLRYDLNLAVMFILKVAIGVYIGIKLAGLL